MDKKKKRIILTVIMIVIIGYWIYSLVDSLDMAGAKVKWVNDINQLEQALVKESPGAFRYVSKKEFHKKLQKLIKETSKLSDSDIRIKLAEIVASLKDDNTRLIKEPSADGRGYPLYAFKNKDSYIVLCIDEKYKEFLGNELIKINDKSIKEIEKRCESLLPNCKKENGDVVSFLGDTDMLKFLGVAYDKEAKFTFKKRSGESTEINLKVCDYKDTRLVSKAFEETFESQKKLLYSSGDNSVFWYKSLEQNKVLYCLYNVYGIDVSRKIYENDMGQELNEESLEYYDGENKIMIEERIDQLVLEAENKNFEKLIIDMRLMGSANKQILDGFVEKVNDIKHSNKSIKVYIITPISERSSIIPELKELKAQGSTIFYGQMNVKYRDNEKETLVILKNSNLILTYSKEKDMEKLNSVFKPDVIVKVSDEELRRGFDSIYEAIIKDK